MHVALVIDDERLHWEHGAINRLCVALWSEGLQLTRIVPDGLLETEPMYEQRMGLFKRIGVQLDVLPWMRNGRAATVLKAMEKSPPDVVHVIGEKAWPVAHDLAKGFGVPMSIELHKASQVLRAPRGRSARQVAAYIAPTMPIAEALRVRVDSDLVSFVPTGVAIPPVPRIPFTDPEEGIAVMILGAATDLAVYRTMLDALARLTKRHSQVQLFLELPSKRSHEIWRHAQRVGLLPRLSVVSHAANHRALVTRCDLVLLPQSRGIVRTITLELLASGIPVVATNDPWLDFLIEGETAAIVGGLDVDEWDERLGAMLGKPELAQGLGARARQWMTANRSSSVQAGLLATTLNRAVTGAALPFEVPA